MVDPKERKSGIGDDSRSDWGKNKEQKNETAGKEDHETGGSVVYRSDHLEGKKGEADHDHGYYKVTVDGEGNVKTQEGYADRNRNRE